MHYVLWSGVSLLLLAEILSMTMMIPLVKNFIDHFPVGHLTGTLLVSSPFIIQMIGILMLVISRDKSYKEARCIIGAFGFITMLLLVV